MHDDGRAKAALQLAVITGGRDVDEFIAERQAESVRLLAEIRESIEALRRR